jgi:hypothetical protein
MPKCRNNSNSKSLSTQDSGKLMCDEYFSVGTIGIIRKTIKKDKNDII